MTHELSAVLFDMDGVLVNSAVVSNRRLTEAARRHGVDLTVEELASLEGASGPQFWGYIKRTYDLPLAPEEYWASYDAEGEVAEYDASLIAGGIHGLLELLRSESIQIGLVTSASRRRTEKAIDFLDIRAFLDAYVCADDVPEHKPHPAPYLAAAKRLDVAPGSCLVIEDSRRGVRSAIAAGMAAEVFTGFATDAEAVRSAVGTIADFALETPETLRLAHRRAADADLGFSYRVRKNGEVEIVRRGRLVTVLRGRSAEKFERDAAGATGPAAQQLMARITGNYKRGNERAARRHPRNHG